MLKQSRLSAIADFLERRGYAPIVRQDRVEFSRVDICIATGELCHEVVAVGTLKEVRTVLAN